MTPFADLDSLSTRPYQELWTSYLLPLGRLFDFIAGSPGGWTSVEVFVSSAAWPIQVHHSELVEIANAASKTSPLFFLNQTEGRFQRIVAHWLEAFRAESFESCLIEGILASGASSEEDGARRFVMALEGLADLTDLKPTGMLTDAEWKRIKRPLKALLEAEGLPPATMQAVAQELKRSPLRARLVPCP